MYNPGENLNHLVPSVLARVITTIGGGDFDDAARCFRFEYEATDQGVIAYSRINNPEKAPTAEIRAQVERNTCSFAEEDTSNPSILLPLVLMGLLSKRYPDRALKLNRPQPDGTVVSYNFFSKSIWVSSDKIDPR